MLPGPDLIKKCPCCGELAKQKTISSGNNFGAKYWTDGWFFAPMLPQSSQLVACPNCKQTAWLFDLQEFDRSPGGVEVIFLMQDLLEGGSQQGQSAKEKLEKREKYKHLPYFEEATENQIARLVKDVPMPVDREIKARTILWRRWNDFRRSNPEENPLNQKELENLNRLSDIMSEIDGEPSLLRVEVERQLGRFKHAEDLLEMVSNSEKNIQMKNYLGKLLSDKDPYLRRVNLTEIHTKTITPNHN